MLANPSFGFNSIFIHVFCHFSSLSKTSAFAMYGKAKLTLDHETLTYLVPFYKATASKTIWSLLYNRLFSITRLFCGGTMRHFENVVDGVLRHQWWIYETFWVGLRDRYLIHLFYCFTWFSILWTIFALEYVRIGHTPSYCYGNESYSLWNVRYTYM